MASWNAIAATTRAVLGLLEDACPRERFATPLQFQAVHAARLAGSDPLPDGFSLLLWRVNVNQSRRNLPTRSTPAGQRFKPSLPVDLHYLLMPAAASVETQQRLLGWGLRLLEDHPVLGAGLLNRYLNEPEVFGPDETVELVADPLPLNDHLNLWDKLKPQMPTAMSFVARMVLIDSERDLQEHPPVRSREFQMAKGAA